jgi:hypothetical protein
MGDPTLNPGDLADSIGYWSNDPVGIHGVGVLRQACEGTREVDAWIVVRNFDEYLIKNFSSKLAGFLGEGVGPFSVMLLQCLDEALEGESLAGACRFLVIGSVAVLHQVHDGKLGADLLGGLHKAIGSQLQVVVERIEGTDGVGVCSFLLLKIFGQGGFSGLGTVKMLLQPP